MNESIGLNFEYDENRVYGRSDQFHFGQRGVPFALHGLHHAQRRQGVDKTRGAFGRSGSRRQRHALLNFERAMLRIHGAADHGDCFAQQRLGRGRAAGLDDDTGAFVAHRHGFVGAGRHSFHELLGYLRGQHGAFWRARDFGGAHVGGAKQQTKIGGVDGRGFDANHDLVGRRLGNLNVL